MLATLRSLLALIVFTTASALFAQTDKPAAAAAAAATSATASPATPPAIIDPAAYGHLVRLACVGDSITYGYGMGGDRMTDSYPAQLGGFLGNKWEVKNFGVSGATLLKGGDKPYWTQQAYKDSLEFNPDVVIIMLGTNDCKPKNWDPHGAEFVNDYKALIKSYADLSSHPHIWITRPVPSFPGNWDITDEAMVKNVLPKIDQVAREASVGLIDQYANLTGHGDLFIDKVHPNAKGARMMVDLFYKTLTGKPTPVVMPVSNRPMVKTATTSQTASAAN